MYKDKDKQREANRKASQRRRDMLKGMANQGVMDAGMTEYPRVSEQEFTKLMATAGPGHVRVSKPSDTDYVPQCETTKAFVEDRAKQPSTAKRGLAIKCFEDLPPDVQQTIRRISQSNEEFQRRTGIAIRYQHLFPERY